LLVIVFLLAVVTGGAIMVTGQPGFCNSCHVMNSYYDSWTKSEHANVNCLDCHLQPGFTGYIRGKVNGLAQAVDCMVGRIGTKPRATVKDTSCTRSDCHKIDELKTDKVDYNGIHFTHEKHIGKVIDGIHVACGTCHSHFEGKEHFSVNNDVCFTCHFLGGATAGEKNPVKTSCLQCHDVPNKVIKRGLVKINHAEFVSYQASCEDSCHGKEVTRPSDVSKTVCLGCHDFERDPNMSSQELHETHTENEKVECFACHGDVSHGQKQVSSVTAMMDCRSCHSETHEVQQSIYSTQETQGGHADRVLSPMFLTHVQCTGCHIDKTPIKGEAVASFGRVAKAVPAACDRCHEKGTGAQLIPFWQGSTKKLYDRLSKAVTTLEAREKVLDDGPEKQDIAKRIAVAQSVLNSVSADGSWGVHNFKYTEALLLEAEKVLNNQ